LIMGLARVLSGTLKVNDEYYCLGPKHTFGSQPPKRAIKMYLLMGSSFVPVKEVPAGHICAVYGLEDLQLKTVTLCDSPDGMPLQGFDRGIRPLVKVNIEPTSAADADALERGLIKLSLADAAVEVTATAKGERILACLGEIHLEQSILDLETIYCGKKDIKLRISEPIVEFAETTEWFENEDDFTAFYDDQSPPLRQTTIAPYNEEEGIAYARRGRTRAVLSGKSAAIGVRVVPLADLVYQSLQSKALAEGSEAEILKLGRSLGCKTDSAEEVLSTLLETFITMDGDGNALIESKSLVDGSCVKGFVGDTVYMPPTTRSDKDDDDEDYDEKKHEALCETVGLEDFQVVQARIRSGLLGNKTVEGTITDTAALEIWKSQMRRSTVAGFQLGMRAGPICEEDVRRVLVVLESAEIALKKDSTAGGSSPFSTSKPLNGGMVVAAMRRGIRCALL
jgi:ribosome assembly protein 1